MMAQEAQTFATHTRRLPPLYLAGNVVLFMNVLYTAWIFFQNPGGATLWQLLVAIGLVMVSLSIRAHATRLQDRIIRSEERIRFSRILPDDLRERIDDLTPAQIVALRFASDEEVPDLARRTLAGEFQKTVEIKRQVKTWRGDYFRV